jgi:periplasmic protein TonB
MFGTLIESRSHIRHSPGGSLVSILAHGTIVLLAVVATEKQVLSPPPRFDPPRIFVRPVAPPPEQPRPVTNGPASTGSVPRIPILQVPLVIPTEIPPIDLLATPTPIDYSVGRGRPSFCGVGCVPSRSVDSAEVQTWSPDDVQMQFRERPVPPRYPERLRSAGVEGIVVVKFIVDTTGRVDLSSVEVTSSTHDLFTAAVRDALGRLRFYPASSGTRKVPAAAIMPFHFTLK